MIKNEWLKGLYLLKFNEMIFDEMIFDEMIFDEMIFDEMIFDEMKINRPKKLKKITREKYKIYCISRYTEKN